MLFDSEYDFTGLDNESRGDETVSNFELPKNKELTVKELLDSKDINQKTRDLLEQLLKVDQRFGDIMLVSNNIEDDPNTGGGIIISATEHGFQISIELSVGGRESLESLFDARPEAVEICKELLKTDRVTAEELQDFIVAHEFGHALDFLYNYSGDENGIKEWREHREAILESLPVPGLTPAELKTAVEATSVNDKYPDRLNNFLSDYKLLNSSRLKDVKSPEQLLRIQERAYRSSPREKFADAFAVKILQS